MEWKEEREGGESKKENKEKIADRKAKLNVNLRVYRLSSNPY